MVYGDLQFFDIIVFAGVAAFLIYRLRNVLGKRSGFEKKIGKPQPKEKNINSLKNIPQLKESESKLYKAYEVLIDFDHKKLCDQKSDLIIFDVGAHIGQSAKKYRKIFDKYFPKHENLIPHFWLPNWSDVKDPSARELGEYKEN